MSTSPRVSSSRRYAIRAVYVVVLIAVAAWAFYPAVHQHRAPRGFLQGPEYTTEFGGKTWSSPLRFTTSDGWALWFAPDHNSVIAVEGGGTDYGIDQWIWQRDDTLMIRDVDRAVRPYAIAGKRDFLLVVRAGQPFVVRDCSPEDYARVWALSDLYPHERKATEIVQAIGAAQ